VIIPCSLILLSINGYLSEMFLVQSNKQCKEFRALNLRAGLPRFSEYPRYGWCFGKELTFPQVMALPADKNIMEQKVAQSFGVCYQPGFQIYTWATYLVFDKV